MLILDQSSWNGHGCLERGGWFALVALTLYAFVFMLGILRRAVSSRLPPRQPLAFTREDRAIALLFLMVAAAIAVVAALSRHGTLLFVEENTLVERGCLQLRAYEDRFDMRAMTMTYRHEEGRGGHRHRIVFAETPHSRAIDVDLAGTRYHRNLLAVAPQAMRDYRAALERHGLPLPPVFRSP